MDHLESVFGQANERLAGLERCFDGMDRHFDAIDRRFDAIDRRFDGVDRRLDGIDRRFTWLIGIVLGTWVITILTLLFHR